MNYYNYRLVRVLLFLILIPVLPFVILYLIWARTKWKRNLKVGATAMASVFMFVFYSAFGASIPSDSVPSTPVTELAASLEQSSIDNSSDTQETDNAIVELAEEGEAEELAIVSESEKYSVISVVDGDTAKVSIDGKTETLRIIGLNTPETVDPRTSVQCFGQEASNKAKSLLEGQEVSLEADQSQGERDTYNRLLRYIVLPDGRNFSQVMIEDGYAFEYTYDLPYRYQSEFKESEQIARQEKRGLWSPDTCNGELKSLVSAPSPVPQETKSPVVVTPPQEEQTPKTDTTSTPSDGVVKKSKSDICHAPGTTYYARTKNFTPYDSIDECLSSGGRLPER